MSSTTVYLVMAKANDSIMGAFSTKEFAKRSIEALVCNCTEEKKQSIRDSLLIVPLLVLNEADHL